MTHYLNKIKEHISDVTGVDTSEIKGANHLEGDLNIGSMELVEILEKLEEEFVVDLMEDKENLETVADILELLTEKLD